MGSTVNRNGGLGGFWAKPNRSGGAGKGNPDSAAGFKSADSAKFSSPADRLASMAGGPAPVFGSPSAAEIVRQSTDPVEVAQKVLKQMFGRDVNLGPHRDKLAAFLDKGLADSHLNFDETKRKL